MNRSRAMTLGIIVLGLILAAGAVMAFTGWGNRQAAYENADRYTAGDADIPAAVRNLDIAWTTGKVEIRRGGAGVTLRETAREPLGEDRQVRWWLDGDTLRVRFAKPGASLGSVFRSVDKTLVLTLPEGAVLGAVRAETVSADLDIRIGDADSLTLQTVSGDGDVTAETVDILAAATTSGDMAFAVKRAGTLTLNGTSGSCAVTADSADTLTLKTVSGGVTADVDRLGEAGIDTTSGAVRLNTRAFTALDIHTVSGDVTAALPSAPGYTARVNSVSGDFSTAVSMTNDGDMHICGDGSGQVRIATTSGDIRINPAQ